MGARDYNRRPVKILVIKRDKIGDMLLTTPLLARLKAALPRAELHLLANDYNAWVVADNPHVDRLWVYRRVRNGGRVSLPAAWSWLLQGAALRRQRFDWVLVANGDESPRAIRRGLAVRGRRTAARCADPSRYPRLTDPLPVDRQGHEVERLLAFAGPVGIATDAPSPLPSYVLPASGARFAARWLGERGLAAGGYVVLGLGARRAKKQPSTAQIVSWTTRLKAAHGLDTVFMWTPGKADDPRYPGDDDIAQPVLDARLPHLHPFRGPIPEALGLIWGAKTSLFPDSGLMHFAAASPGGVVGFFAETGVSPSPAQWAPRGARATFLEEPRSVAELSEARLFAALEPFLG